MSVAPSRVMYVLLVFAAIRAVPDLFFSNPAGVGMTNPAGAGAGAGFSN